MSTILLAGATGTLGRSVLGELKRRGYHVRALAREPAALNAIGATPDEIIRADVTRPETLGGACDGIDVVISTVGASLRMGRSRPGESFRAIDYQGNRNLLDAAIHAGVGRFIYVSLFDGWMLSSEYACAHEDFVMALHNSGIEYVIIRPTGFFSAFREILEMARRGWVMMIGNGSARTNPVHEDDIAIACVDAIDEEEIAIELGGPTTYTRREISELAFAVLGKRPRIASIPAGLASTMLIPLRQFDGRLHDVLRFFIEIGTHDVIAPVRGSRELADYFREHAGKDER